MQNKVIVIVGSSRSDGDTQKMVNELIKDTHFDTIDLNDYDISYYDYAHKNAEDDYLKLMKNLIANYDTFVFATPVYWYAMSGIMKVFFDRITDLLDNEKELGRKLRTKKMAVISCSTGGNLGKEFWLPFKESANYLGMKYLGDLHTITKQIDSVSLKKFAEAIAEG
jgi:multimeric flavodoxin WrbA